MKFSKFILINEQDPPMPDMGGGGGLGAAPPMPDTGGGSGLGAAPPMPDMGGGLGAAPPMPGMDNSSGLGAPPMPGMDGSQGQDTTPVIPQIKNVWDVLDNLLDEQQPISDQNLKMPSPEISFSNKKSPLMR